MSSTKISHLNCWMVKNKGPVLVERDWLQKILLDWYTIKSMEVSQAPPIARERL